jgi:hypothetical protein
MASSITGSDLHDDLRQRSGRRRRAPTVSMSHAVLSSSRACSIAMRLSHLALDHALLGERSTEWRARATIRTVAARMPMWRMQWCIALGSQAGRAMVNRRLASIRRRTRRPEDDLAVTVLVVVAEDRQGLHHLTPAVCIATSTMDCWRERPQPGRSGPSRQRRAAVIGSTRRPPRDR